jgi:hypothetical protein
MSRDTEDEDEPTDFFSELYKFGLAIFCDDAPDFPEIISHWGKEPGKHGILKGQTMPDLPAHVHHWVLGALIMASATFGKVYFALDSRQEEQAAQEV